MSESMSTKAAPNQGFPNFVYFTKTVHHEPYEKISPFRPELSARGKNIVVTGGGTGIGKAIAIAFAQAGAQSVSILGRREDRLKSAVTDLTVAATNPEAVFLYESTDLTKRTEVEKALQSIVERVGRLDILVSNAGVLPAVGPIASYEGSELIRGFTNNVLSAFNAIQAFLPLSSTKPIILNISSGIGHMAPIPGFTGHASSKAAAFKVIDYFAAENPSLHIVHVQPGGVDTEMSAIVGIKGQDAAELPGHFCVWLASPEAKFLKSKYVWANWDAEEMMNRADELENSRLLTWYLDGVPM